MDRANAALGDLDHDKVSRGFVDNAIAGDIWGHDDDKISSQLSAHFVNLEMSSKRTEIGEKVRKLVAAGKLTTWLTTQVMEAEAIRQQVTKSSA